MKGLRKPGDVQLSGLYTHQRAIPWRAFLAQAQDLSRRIEPAKLKALSGGAEAADARTDPGTGSMVGSGTARLLWVSRSAYQLPSLEAFHHRQCWYSGTARYAAPQPEGRDYVGAAVARLAAEFLPGPRILHPWPEVLAFSSLTQGGSRVPKLGPLGSVRGALSNERPYRDQSSLRGSSVSTPPIRHR